MKSFIFALLFFTSCCIKPEYVRQIKYQTVPYQITQCKICKEPSYLIKLDFNVTDVDLPAYENKYGIKHLDGMGNNTISVVMLPGYDPEVAVAAITNRIQKDYNRNK